MKTTKHAAGETGSAGTLLPSAKQISTLLNLGVIALELWRAEEVAANARAVYLGRISRWEGEHGCIQGRLSPDNPAHLAVIKFSASQYLRHQAAKRAVYNVKRRMKTACQNAARLAAHTGSKK